MSQDKKPPESRIPITTAILIGGILISVAVAVITLIFVPAARQTLSEYFHLDNFISYWRTFVTSALFFISVFGIKGFQLILSTRRSYREARKAIEDQTAAEQKKFDEIALVHAKYRKELEDIFQKKAVELEESLNLVRQSRDDLSEEVGRLRETVEDLRTQINDYKEERKELLEKLRNQEELHSIVVASREEASRLEQIVEERDKRIARLLADVATLTSQVETENRNATACAKESAKLQERVDQLVSKLEKYKPAEEKYAREVTERLAVDPPQQPSTPTE